MNYRFYAVLASVSAAGFTGGFLARGELTEARAAPVKASEVAVEHAPDAEDAPQDVAGNALGAPVLRLEDGKTVAAQEEKITPLYARDPSAMVMGVEAAGPSCPADPPCDCSQDDLHRYRKAAPRRKDLESLPPAKSRN